MNRKADKKKLSRSKQLLILIVSAVIAVALGLTCGLCFGTGNNSVGTTSGVNSGNNAIQSADHVVTQPTADNDTVNDYTPAAALQNNDVLNFNYVNKWRTWDSNKYYTVKLPKGKYKFEVWGARGGQGGDSTYFYSSWNISRGGYSVGTIEIADTTTFYIYNGGMGEGNSTTNTYYKSCLVPGGYNGGGDAYHDGGEFGGSGGGATHIATRKGLLKDLKNYTSDIIMVAGAGGGTGEDNETAGWGGGTESVKDSSASYTANQTKAGTRGDFGQGANYNSTSESGGGGGGGYWGGGGGEGGGSGGGSGYVNTSKLTGAQTLAGDKEFPAPGSGTETGHTGSGCARITAIMVNQAPVQQSYPDIEGQPIGTSAKTIYSYEIAKDNDYTNYYTTTNQVTANSVFFVNGAATNAADIAGGATTGLYLDKACSSTARAETYIDYSFTDNKTLVINGYKKQPREKVAGATADNELTVYVGIRDGFGGTSTTYARGVYQFKIKFANITATHQSGSQQSGNYTINYGPSTTQSALEAMNTGKVYSPAPNPLGTWALTIQQPIQKFTSVTIDAADLIKITAPSGTNPDYFQAILVPTPIAGVADLYEFLGNGQAIAFGSNGAYKKITIRATGSSPLWQNIKFTLYMVEKTTAGGSSNQLPVGITYTKQDIDVNFKVDNTRPTLRASQSNVVDVPVGAEVNVPLNTYFNDIDGEITIDTHKILGVEVPDKEFVQLDKYGKIGSTYGVSGALSSSYYNLAGGSIDDALETGTSTVPTNFNPNIASPSWSEQAFVQYAITSNDTITLTGLRASYSQYQRTAVTAYTSSENDMADVKTSGGISNPGHFYLLLHIQDNNDTLDTGIYLPIAVRVGAATTAGGAMVGALPVNTGSSAGSVSGQGMLSDMPRAVGDVGDSFYFVPMALNINDAEYPVGKIVDNDNNELANGVGKDKVQALALDGDNFATTTGLAAWNGNKLNEFISIATVPTKVSDPKRTVDYAEISTVNVYVPKSYFGGRVKVGSSAAQDAATGVNTIYLASGKDDYADYYVTTGIKITLLSATMNRYFYVNVGLSDSHANPISGGVNIAINVSNTNPNVIDKKDIAKLDEDAFEYNYDGTITISYKVPMRSTFFITPYDLISDINMLDGGAKYPTGGFTLNGLSGKYASNTFTVNGTAGTSDEKVSALYDSNVYGEGNTDYDYVAALTAMLNNLKNRKEAVAAVANSYAVGTVPSSDSNIFNDRLFFVRTSDTTSDAYTFNPTSTDFVYGETNTADYVDIFVGNTVNIGGNAYNIDFLMFKAMTRTARDAEITLSVRDRYGLSVIPIKIKIAIVNTAPKVKKIDVPELAVAAVDETGNAIYPTSVTVSPDGVMSDFDGDRLVFVPSRGILVARGNKISGVDTLVGFGTTETTKKYKDLMYDTDADSGNLLTDCYLRAVMNSSEEFVVTALGSTKSIEDGVYVYFFATDSRGGTVLGYMPVEVVNTSPKFNVSDVDGFSGADRLWSLESARSADLTRSRYIVGSDNARAQLKAQKNAADADIKLIATDADALHGKSGVILSQHGGMVTSNVNHGSDYELSVPSVSTDNVALSLENPAAVIAVIENNKGDIDELPDTVEVKPIFYVNGEWYERDTLITELEKTSGGKVSHSDVFDDDERWIVNDWAVRVVVSEAFVNYKLRLTFTVRDDTRYGGDTAGVSTAFKSDRTDNETVDGYLETPSVYMYISGTGILTKDEYNVYNNNYVVDYGSNPTTTYLVEKTGDTLSAVEYSASNAASSTGKFEYPTTITVPASKDGSKTYSTVYVPMSYFGQQQTLVTQTTGDHEVHYQDTFVGYDVRSANGNNVAYSISSINDIASAISLYDGTTTWRGTSGKNPLSDNPYITIGAVDYTAAMNGNSSFSDDLSKFYYNTQLSVPIDGDLDYNGAPEDEFFKDGKLLYLKDQTTKLLEHNFGLSFTKKNMRTGSFNLQLTLNLALSQVSGRETSNAIKAETACTKSGDTRSVTVSIRVDNTPVDLELNSASSPLKYDGTYYVDVEMTTSASKGFTLVRTDSSDNVAEGYERIYYMDNDYFVNASNKAYRDMAYFSLESINGLSEASNLRPSLKDDGVFTNTTTAQTGDTARAQSSMLNYYSVAQETGEIGYIANRGLYSYNSYFNVTTSDSGRQFNIKAARKTYINESALKDIVEEDEVKAQLTGFTSWDDSLTYGGLTYGQLAKIYATRGLCIEYADNIASDSGAVIPDSMKIKRIYYPLKALIYDTCSTGGLGWSDASYVSVEFRVTILNTAPTINGDSIEWNAKNNRYEKVTKLAVGSTMYIELEKYIIDPDIYMTGSQLATVLDFNAEARGVDRETGDYLESLFAYNYTSYSSAEQAQNALLNNSAGLSAQGSEDADVIMYMEAVRESDGMGGHKPVSKFTIPSNNRLWFRVNRRTSDNAGKIRDTFEFTMTFRDNHHSIGSPSETKTVAFIINIDNQAPTITTKVNKVTMHTGDTLVLLPAYYDTFIGGKENLTPTSEVNGNRNPAQLTFDVQEDGRTSYKLPQEGTAAYLKSSTYRKFYNNVADEESWKFYDITSDKYEKAFKTDTSNGSGNENLGFLGVASDDAPWRLRFTSSPYTMHSKYITVSEKNAVRPELREGEDFEQYPTALVIEARGACSQRSVDFEIFDGEGGSVIYTLEFTIISAPPRPLDPNNANELSMLNKVHLNGVKNPDYVEGGIESEFIYSKKLGTFGTFIIPSGDAKGVSVDLGTGFGEVTAYKDTEILLNNVAVDPDDPSGANWLELHGDGYFKVNNQDLSIVDGRYVSNYFYITKSSNNGFTIHATGYNPSQAYETLSFRIADSGNDVYNNSLEINIRVYTVYSDMENPTVGKMSKTEYDSYLEGSNKVRVKAYDEYLGIGKYGTANAGTPTVYNYVYFAGDSDNLDGTPEYPIVDHDVRKAGTQSYSASVYAFMENGKALSRDRVNALIGRNGNKFTIKDGVDVDQYLIGGVDRYGNSVEATPSALANVSAYFNFTVAQDGASISFIPKTATFDKKILLFVNVQKRIGTRDATRVDNAVAAGTLFTIEVEDSAPRNLKTDEQDYNREFVGTKGSSVTYRIYGGNRGESLFEDSDADDVLSIDIPSNANDAWYKDNILADAIKEDDDLDWASDSAVGKVRAITVTSSGEYITITINRRMDEKLDNGSYADEVKFAIVLTCTDREGKSDKATISITVCNTAVTAVESFEKYEKIGENSVVGYSFEHVDHQEYNNEYIMRAKVHKGLDLTIDFADILVDPDYEIGKNVDSFRFAEGRRQSSFKYLVGDQPETAIYYADDLGRDPRDLAKVTPVSKQFGDDRSYTGFTINAEASVRNRSGSLRLFIVDRSAEEANERVGVYITLEITVINAAPEWADGIEDGYTINVLGSDTAPVGELFYLKDFFKDENESDVVDMENAPIDWRDTETWLRISGVDYSDYSVLNASDKATLPSIGSGDDKIGYSDDSSLMFTVVYSEQDTGNAYEQAFRIRPNLGFYGSGEFILRVADGNINEYPDTENKTLRIRVNVIYNPTDIKEMQIDPMSRGKKRTITMTDLVKDIDNKFSESMDQSNAASKAASNKFNPASWYVLESVTPSQEATDYVKVEKNSDGTFTLTALAVTAPATKRVNIEYALKADKENSVDGNYATYTSYFDLRINENMQPKLTYNKMTFERYAEDGTIDPMFKLDTGNTVSLYVEQLFTDPEDDVMRFVSVKSNKSSLVTARVSEDKDRIIIKFTASGYADLSITVTDESGANYTYSPIRVTNTDLPEPDLWTRFLASLESNKVMWAIIFASIILAIIILIIIIAIVKKRKRAREELEALLVSEMEIEEQMLKLSGGPSPTGYQSFGYLPPTPTGPTVDPSMMLGAGMNAPTDQHLELAAPPTQQRPNASQPESTNPYDGDVQ